MQAIRSIKIWILAGLLLSITSVAAEINPDSIIMREYASAMHFWPEGERQQQASDSITHYWWGEKRYFNRDTLFARSARLGIDSVRDQMHFYCSDILDAIPNAEERTAEVQKMRKSIERYGPEKLEVIRDVCEATAMFDSTAELFTAKIKRFYELAEKYAALGNIQEELSALRYIFIKSYNSQYYSKAFRCAPLLEKRLDEVTDAEYDARQNDWYYLGNAYYEFGDYDHAIPLLKKALRDEPVAHFSDRYNLRARNTLGVYYRDQGDLDSSDYYFRSMLNSRDWVKFRPMYDCIAVSNLATNLRRRGNYRGALALHRMALPRSISEMDWSFTSGIYVGLAECYLETGHTDSCKIMIDSVNYYMDKLPWVRIYRQCDLFPVMARYYAAIGKTDLSLAYMDSTTRANHRMDQEFNALKILRAKQELFDSEQILKDIQVYKLRRFSIVVGSAAVIIFVALLILFFIYRRKHRAYRLLAARTRQWAEQAPELEASPHADKADIDLMNRINEVIDNKQLYLDPDLRLETLSEHLGMHRNHISKAINLVYEKSFATYINECRVRHAIRLLSDPSYDHLSLDAIALDSGFPSRTTFYRVFKAQTNINPATYRQNRGKGTFDTDSGECRNKKE